LLTQMDIELATALYLLIFYILINSSKLML